jgi:hypothetical protein
VVERRNAAGRHGHRPVKIGCFGNTCIQVPAEELLLVSAIFEIPAPGLGIPALLKPRKYLGIFQFHERRDRDLI